MIKYEYNGKKLYLFYNAAARFALEDIRAEWNESVCDGAESVAEIISQNSAAAYIVLCKAAEILSEQGAVARHMLGLKSDTVTAAEIETLATPFEINSLRLRVISAMSEGLEIPGAQAAQIESDGFLADIQKKTEPERPGRKRPHMFGRG